MKHAMWISVVCTLLFCPTSPAQGPDDTVNDLTATEIIQKAMLALHYQGDDMKTVVSMELIDKDGGTRRRVMTMARWDERDGGNQKYFTYFHEPGDVRQMTFMVWKYPEKEDDRWIFIPAVDLIRRIAADDKRSSFVGSDFTYEDMSGRDAADDTHSFIREDTLDNRVCFVIESVPKTSSDYTKRLSWIDKQIFIPLREEYYDAQAQLYRVFTADKIDDIVVGEGENRKVFPTVTKRTMTSIKTAHRTEVTFTSITYNSGLEERDFSERSMRKPPRAWIRK